MFSTGPETDSVGLYASKFSLSYGCKLLKYLQTILK